MLWREGCAVEGCYFSVKVLLAFAILCERLWSATVLWWTCHREAFLQENVRASKLADTLTAVEDKLADQEIRKICKMT